MCAVCTIQGKRTQRRTLAVGAIAALVQATPVSVNHEGVALCAGLAGVELEAEQAVPALPLFKTVGPALLGETLHVLRVF